MAELSRVNAALGAMLQAALTPTTEIRAVVVSAEDMGSSLKLDMMDDMPDSADNGTAMRIVNLSTANAVNASSGCSTGEVRRFNSNNERIYVTARVEGLRANTYFEVDWTSGERVLYRVSWRASYAAAARVRLVLCHTCGFPIFAGQLPRHVVCQW